jgi:hypothetical protein
MAPAFNIDANHMGMFNPAVEVSLCAHECERTGDGAMVVVKANGNFRFNWGLKSRQEQQQRERPRISDGINKQKNTPRRLEAGSGRQRGCEHSN